MSPFFIISLCVYTTLTAFHSELSLSALQRIDLQGQQRKGPSSPRVPDNPALSDVTMASSLSALTLASDAVAVSTHGPDEYEKSRIITASPRMATTRTVDEVWSVPRLPFGLPHYALSPSPSADTPNIPVKLLFGVFDTPLNSDAVGPQVCDLNKARRSIGRPSTLSASLPTRCWERRRR